MDTQDRQLQGFIKQALQAGVAADNIEQLVAQRFGLASKQAAAAANQAPSVDSVVTSLLSDAGLNKTAQTAGYVQGLLAEAIDAGASFGQACKVAELALLESKQTLDKQAAETAAAELAVRQEGFLKAALDAGYDERQAREMLVHRYGSVKQADAGMMPQGMPGMDQLFKQSPSGGMGGGGGQPDMGALQQLIQLIQQSQQGQQQQQGAPPMMG